MKAGNASRPNVIIITTDQQRTDTLSCYGSSFTSTPNLDRLGAEGAIFNRAYCANPVCTPARAGIFTGQYLSRHAAWNVGMNVPEDTVMVSHRLRDVGYRTHYIGKAHFQAHGKAAGDRSVESLQDWQSRYPVFGGPFYGFETVELCLGHGDYGVAGHYGAWAMSQASDEELARIRDFRVLGDFQFSGNACDWEIPLRLHNSVWAADRAIDFLQNHEQNKPFLLSIGFQDPHHPHGVPTEFTDRVRPEDVPLPRYTEGELDDKPPHFHSAHTGALETSPLRGEYKVGGQGTGHDFRRVTEKDARLGRAYYHTMVRLIDREMGRILACLDNEGLTDNTLIIFTTDHGELLGDHGLWMKGPFHYEELVRIPLLVRWPAGIPAGQRTDALISQVDLVPSILAAVGVDQPHEEMDGLNMLPLMCGDSAQSRDAAIVECVDNPGFLRAKSVVTEDRKLTFYHGQSFGELYDLRNDPGEIRNLWNDPAYAADKHTLMSRLMDHMEPLERRVPRLCYA